jgi:transcriptional regulator GlxA family with amidase domain
MEHYCETDIINQVIEQVQLSERTLKRRFKKATNLSLIEYIQNLRIEEAKRLLESTQFPVDEISVAVSYEDPSFFRRLFKRLTGLNPSQYRRMFQPITNAQSKSPNTLQY